MNIKEYKSLAVIENEEIFMNILKERYDDYSFLACKLSADNSNKSIHYGGMAMAIRDLLNDIKNSRETIKKMKQQTELAR